MSAIGQNSREQPARRDSDPDAIIVYNRIAAPGLHSLQKNPLLCHLTEALEAQEIKLLDPSGDLREQLRRLVPAYPGGSAAANP
jgi:hypothetical protein